jgi:competence protein ComEC
LYLVAALILLAIGLIFRRMVLIVACVFGGLLLGLWRGSAQQADLQAYDSLISTVATITGVVREDVDTRPDGTYVLRIGEVQYGSVGLPGVIWVVVADAHSVQRSDSVTIRGTMTAGFGNNAATFYRAELLRAERPYPGDVALTVRNWFGGSVREHIAEPQSSLGLGFLLGERRSLPAELEESLRTVGLTHIIVASGYNLTILVRFARRIFVKVSRYAALLAAGGMVASFIAITGMSPSMSRAGLVAGLSLLAWYYGRTFHPLVLLPFAAAVTVLVNPSYAWGDTGWQLSFTAFFGVMVVAPLLQAYFFGAKKPTFIRQIMGETIAAQLATAPILIATFGQLSSMALLANLVILPFVPLAMMLVFATGVVSTVLPLIATAVSLPAQWLLTYMTTIVTWIAELPWAMMQFSVNGWFVGVYYIVLGGLCVYIWHASGYRLRDSNIIE